jgi:hypothetical protein
MNTYGSSLIITSAFVQYISLCVRVVNYAFYCVYLFFVGCTSLHE